MRVLNRPLAFILAAALVVASIIVIIEVIAASAHHGPVVLRWTTWYRWAESTRWDARVVQVWSAILIVAGALILAVELKPPPGHPAAAARRPPGHRRRADPRRAGRDPARRSDQH